MFRQVFPSSAGSSAASLLPPAFRAGLGRCARGDKPLRDGHNPDTSWPLALRGGPNPDAFGLRGNGASWALRARQPGGTESHDSYTSRKSERFRPTEVDS